MVGKTLETRELVLFEVLGELAKNETGMSKAKVQPKLLLRVFQKSCWMKEVHLGATVII
jgi:hypothetical protein